SDNGGRWKLSQLPGEVALQKSSAAFSRRQISLPVPYLSKVCRPFPHCSFATTPDRSTLVDQPTIMLRNVSHPSAKTRITCGTTKRMETHLSKKCQKRAALYRPHNAASQ